MKKLLLCIGLLVWSATAHAEWTFPITVGSGSASSSLLLGVESGASNGYDAGKDTPGIAYEDEVVYGCLPHPEWGVVVGGENIYAYIRDIRGSLPQIYQLEVRSLNVPITISWNSSALPAQTTMSLTNPTAGVTVNMAAQSSYTFSPGGTSPVTLEVSVSQGDVSPPSAPNGISIEERGNALYVQWDRNAEADLGGYKLHFGTNSGDYKRTIDVRNATNYSLMNLQLEEYYYVVLTAYDQNGNESDYSGEVSSSYGIDFEPPLSPVGLNVSETETSLTLSWEANTENDLVGYKVYVGAGFGDYALSYNVGLATQFQLPSPMADQVYYFAVSAYDAKDNESSLSSSVSGALKGTEDTSVPDVPDNTEELPTEEGTGTSGARFLIGSTIYRDIPGQSKGETRTNNDSEKTDGQRKKNVSGKEENLESKKRSEDKQQTDDPGSVAVSVKAGEYRIEFDAQPWKLMTIPLKVSLNKPFSEFVARSAEMNKLIGWDNKTQSYHRLKYPRPGAAFWLKAGKGHAVFKGQPYREKNALFTLEKGWNLIGSPYLEKIALDQLRVKLEDKLLALPKAVAEGVLSNVLQSYVEGEFLLNLLDNAGHIEPWRGYWVNAKSPCELVIFEDQLPKTKAGKTDTRAENKPEPHAAK